MMLEKKHQTLTTNKK